MHTIPESQSEQHLAESSPCVNIDDFAKYLTYASFQEAVHQVKKLSLERVITNETIPEYHGQLMPQGLAKIA